MKRRAPLPADVSPRDSRGALRGGEHRLEESATSGGRTRVLTAAILCLLVLVAAGVSLMAAMGWGDAGLLSCHSCHM